MPNQLSGRRVRWFLIALLTCFIIGSAGFILSRSSRSTIEWDVAAEVVALAWSPDATRLATAEGEYFGEQAVTTVRIRDVVSGQVVQELPVGQGLVSVLAWSPNGQRLAVSAAGTIHVWHMGSEMPPL